MICTSNPLKGLVSVALIVIMVGWVSPTFHIQAPKIICCDVLLRPIYSSFLQHALRTTALKSHSNGAEVKFDFNYVKVWYQGSILLNQKMLANGYNRWFDRLVIGLS